MAAGVSVFIKVQCLGKEGEEQASPGENSFPTSYILGLLGKSGASAAWH